MKTRCYNENTDFFKHYGGRGIKVCDEWKDSFFAFYEWAIKNGYDDDLSIDRIDVNGDYEPSNCRWATKEQQSLNTRRKRLYSFQGETHTLKEWSKILNINYTTLRSRIIYMNWDISKAFREVEI